MAAPEEHDVPPGSAPDPVPFQLPEGFANDETAQLVARAKSGDAGALNDLFRRYHHMMVEIARRKIGPKLRLKEEPDDLAQTTFREAARDFPNYEYRGEASLVRWFQQILQNKIRDKAEFYAAGKRDYGRERSMDAPLGGDPEGPRTSEPESTDLSVTMQVTRDESLGVLRGALEELSPDHRQAITLVFFEGRQLREAGEIMGGRTEDAVRMMLRRAESRLGEILRRTLGKDLRP
ncbi:MAG: sigma-70 family RNA polymerase sigma factor [Planctomycetes bacterium]|nr:sigma-70 family RNA polymerase sigma factor [Planctomycetota bacterium]